MTITAYDPKTEKHPPSYDCTTSTPWGTAQYANRYASGIISYGTAGHGGFHLSLTRNKQVHKAWRAIDGWYEEDCDWAIVAVTFPEAFHADIVEMAHACAKNWNPHGYEAATGTKVALEESLKLRDEAFDAAHVNDWVVTSASGDWADWVPYGMVGVCATLGGRHRSHYAEETPEERYFLVTKERYDAREGSYVVDETVDIHTKSPKEESE